MRTVEDDRQMDNALDAPACLDAGATQGTMGGTMMRMHDRREHAANWRTETVNPTAVLV
jgi:hypothetical protein